jgi:hypothetical protein
MSDEILSHLRRAHALSQGGRCVESAQVILTALGAMRSPTEAAGEEQHTTSLQKQRLIDSLWPLLKYVPVCHTSFVLLARCSTLPQPRPRDCS